MASPYLPTEQAVAQSSPEVMGIERQRKLADLLTAQGLNQPQGQMISGHYVPPSWTQQIAPMASVLAGNAVSERADKQQQQLAAALRAKQAGEIEKFGELEQQDKAAALRYALSTDNPILRSMAQEQLKGIKLGEGEVFTRPSLSGGNVEMKGAAKYHAPIQIDTGTAIELRDPLDPTRVISRMPKSQMPTAGQVVETANGPMLINTRTGAAQPIMVNGEQLPPKLSPEQSKDITAINQQTKTIDGAIEAIKKNPNAFSYARGLAGDMPKGETIAARYQKPEETAARSYVYNNVSAVIKERAGTAQSSGEAKRLNSFLPDTYDDGPTIISKFEGFKDYLKDLEAGTRQNPNVPSTPKPPQAPNAPKTPAVDPALFQFMTPEQKALFGIK